MILYGTGEQLAISSHGSALLFASGLQTPQQDGSEMKDFQSQQLLSLEQLPLRCVGHLSESELVGAGFDGEVGLFERRGLCGALPKIAEGMLMPRIG